MKVDFEKEFDNVYIFGNAGLQVIQTDQQSTGASGTSNAQGFVTTVPVSEGAKYTETLPSLNINFDFGEGHITRFSASKVISRPRFDYMKPGGSVNFNFNVANVIQTDPAEGPWSASSGNPALRPLEANQFDLAYDWYFADDGYISVAYFYKDLVNWHRNGSTLTDFSDFYEPDYHRAIDTTTGDLLQPGTLQGFTAFKEDGLTGRVKGFEVTSVLPLRVISNALDGFGIIASASFSDGKLDDENNEDARVPGLSERVYQLTAFYEREGFSARLAGTKRSDYESEIRNGAGLSTIDKQPITLLDAQMGYDFSYSSMKSLDGLSVTLKALNLTKEDDTAADADDPRLITQNLRYGTTYMLEASYKF